MAKKSPGKTKHQIHESGGEALEAAQAQNAGSNFEWHFGRVTCLGNYSIAFANFKQANNAFAASSPLFPTFPPLR